MSSITVFKNSKALVGRNFFDLDDDAIALIECDDKYDEKALDLIGEDDVDSFIKKSKCFKFFCDVTKK